MKQIKVNYRALFAQPIGVLNPSGFKMGGTFAVEIFGSKDNWQARSVGNLAVYKKLAKFASAHNGRQVVEDSFAEKVTPWQIWGTPPMDAMMRRDFKPVEGLLDPSELQVMSDGSVYWKEPDDYTHILHAPSHDPKIKGMPPAACGQKVHVKAFINNRANVEPTCKACAQVWREHYQEKSA